MESGTLRTFDRGTVIRPPAETNPLPPVSKPARGVVRVAILAAAALLGGLIALAYVLIAPPTYEAGATLRITGEAGAAVMEREMAFIRSDAVLDPVIAIENLQTDPDFADRASDSFVDLFLRRVGGEPNPAMPAQPTDYDHVMALLKERLTVRPGVAASTLEIAIRGPNPQRAAQLANTIADVYIDAADDLAPRSMSGARAIVFANGTPDRAALAAAARAADDAVARLRARTGFIDDDDRAAAQARTLSARERLVDARIALRQIQIRRNAVKQALADGTAGALSDPTLDDLRQKRAHALSDPAVSDADRQAKLVAIDAEIRFVLGDLAAKYDLEAQIATAAIAPLEAESADADIALMNIERTRVRLAELQDEAETARRLYEASVGARTGANAKPKPRPARSGSLIQSSRIGRSGARIIRLGPVPPGANPVPRPSVTADTPLAPSPDAKALDAFVTALTKPSPATPDKAGAMHTPTGTKRPLPPSRPDRDALGAPASESGPAETEPQVILDAVDQDAETGDPASAPEPEATAQIAPAETEPETPSDSPAPTPDTETASEVTAAEPEAEPETAETESDGPASASDTGTPSEVATAGPQAEPITAETEAETDDPASTPGTETASEVTTAEPKAEPETAGTETETDSPAPTPDTGTPSEVTAAEPQAEPETAETEAETDSPASTPDTATPSEVTAAESDAEPEAAEAETNSPASTPDTEITTTDPQTEARIAEARTETTPPPAPDAPDETGFAADELTRSEEAAARPGAELLTSATPPAQPVSPTPAVIVTLGAGIGFLAGLALVFITGIGSASAVYYVVAYGDTKDG